MKKYPQVFDSLLDKEYYNDEDIKEIINKVKEYKGIEKAIDIANKYTEKAFRDINKLPKNKYRDILLDVTSKLLLRSY